MDKKILKWDKLNESNKKLILDAVGGFSHKYIKCNFNELTTSIKESVEDYFKKSNRSDQGNKRILKAYYDTGGICYSRVGFPLTTEGLIDAKYFSDKIISSKFTDVANGGMLDGMPMGGIHKCKNSIEVYVNFYNYYENKDFEIVFLESEWKEICLKNK